MQRPYGRAGNTSSAVRIWYYVGGLLGESERKNLTQMSDNSVGVVYNRLHTFLPLIKLVWAIFGLVFCLSPVRTRVLIPSDVPCQTKQRHCFQYICSYLTDLLLPDYKENHIILFVESKQEALQE
ncbi:MAG: hypothetical protein J7647_10440 [Cyanobacteria bacterium SBLK]|nr:hypothetical protein [Cyanobacteria bacterium SBLK]